MFLRSDDLSYLVTRCLNLVGIYISNINLEIDKQINRTSSVEISSAKSRATNNIAPALYITWLFQCDEPHCDTSKAISSLPRSGEKHTFVSTRNTMVHHWQLPAKC